MNVTYIANGDAKNINVDNFYYDIANLLCTEPADSGIIMVECPLGRVEYQIRPRSGTIFITEVHNDLPVSLLKKDFSTKFLTCVDPEKNAYKFYKLEPESECVKASYGRMGTQKGELFGERSYKYPLSMFWVKYFEKIAKGYKDQSEFYCDTTEMPITTSPKKENGTGPSVQLFGILRSFAKNAVKKEKVQVPITPAIIAESKRLVDEMRGADTVDEFNGQLMSLIAVLQRPVKTGDGTGVKKLLADSSSDFAHIIQREVDLIQAMEGSVDTGCITSGDFSDYDIEVYYATEKQKQQVLAHLSDALKLKVKNIYRVIPRKQKEIFEHYLEKHKIKKVKQLWHGSRNQNWMSIIQNGLLLNPDAVITGKMFGAGIYFAPSSEKSWNYTSYKNTRWAKGTEDIAFMGLYATAYGTPYDVNVWSSSANYKTETKKHNADCLHAHKGVSLKNDEIVFFNEEATLLQYIVEFH